MIHERTLFMDSVMEECSKYKIGETLYNLETSKELGIIDELYRYSNGGGYNDSQLNIDYRFSNGRNTSSYGYSIDYGNHDDLVKYTEKKLRELKNKNNEKITHESLMEENKDTWRMAIDSIINKKKKNE